MGLVGNTEQTEETVVPAGVYDLMKQVRPEEQETPLCSHRTSQGEKSGLDA